MDGDKTGRRGVEVDAEKGGCEMMGNIPSGAMICGVVIILIFWFCLAVHIAPH